jgi:hypothetical protein
VTDRETGRQTDRLADRYAHLHLEILIIPSTPYVSVPEKQEIENRTPLSQLCRTKYACGLYLSSAQLIFYSQPPCKQTNILIYDVTLLHFKLSDTQDNSANTILFRRLKNSENKIQCFIVVPRILITSKFFLPTNAPFIKHTKY